MAFKLSLVPWRTVRLGLYTTALDYLDVAESKGVRCSPDARAVLAHLELPGVVRAVTLTQTTLRELGMHRIDTHRCWWSGLEILAHRKESGLARINPEVILALAAERAPLTDALKFSTDCFDAPRYKTSKRVYIRDGGLASYSPDYSNGQLRLWRTGAGHCEGPAYRYDDTIVFAMT